MSSGYYSLQKNVTLSLTVRGSMTGYGPNDWKTIIGPTMGRESRVPTFYEWDKGVASQNEVFRLYELVV